MSVKLLASKKIPATYQHRNTFFLICLQQVTKNLFEMGCYEVSLGDTIGVGTPGKVETPNYSCIDMPTPRSIRPRDL